MKEDARDTKGIRQGDKKGRQKGRHKGRRAGDTWETERRRAGEKMEMQGKQRETKGRQL